MSPALSSRLEPCEAREADGSPSLNAEEGETLVRSSAVSLFVGDDLAGEAGMLYVTTRCEPRPSGSALSSFAFKNLRNEKKKTTILRPFFCQLRRRVVWLSGTAAKGHSIPFRRMGVHGVSRDTEAFPHACIFAQVEAVRPEPGFGDEGEEAAATAGDGEEEEEDDEDEEEDETVDLRFVPPNPADGAVPAWAPALRLRLLTGCQRYAARASFSGDLSNTLAPHRPQLTIFTASFASAQS